MAMEGALDSVAYGNGVWVATSGDDLGAPFLRSADGGQTWIPVEDYAADLGLVVAYGNGVWVGVATDDGVNQVARSTDDGVNWTTVAAAEGNAWNSVAYGNGVWVAVSGDGVNRVMRSTDDGVNWTATAALMDDNYWYNLGYGNGVFIAVTGGGPFPSAHSFTRSIDNGKTWTPITIPNGYQAISIDYGNGVWIASHVYVGIDGEDVDPDQRALRSTDDGLTWSVLTNYNDDCGPNVIAYGNGVWIGDGCYDSGTFERSTDGGLTWTLSAPLGATNTPSHDGIAYGNGVWMSVGYTGGEEDVVRSTDDGLTWSPITFPVDIKPRSIEYANGVWIAMGNTDEAMRSTDDGQTWNSINTNVNYPECIGPDGWTEVSYGNGVWLATNLCADHQMIRSTDDGLTWAGVGDTPSGYQAGVIYGNCTWVAITPYHPGTLQDENRAWYSSDPNPVACTPTNITGTAGEKQVALSWHPPADTGTTITSYTATASPGGATCTSATPSCTVTGLTNGTAYTFTVVATNSVGGQSPTSAASAPITPPSNDQPGYTG